jgi:type VII secretion protein EccE
MPGVAAQPAAAPAVLRAATTLPVARVPHRPAPTRAVSAPRPPVAAARPDPVPPPRPPDRSPRRGLVLPIVAGELVLVLVLLVLDRSWPAIVAVACCGVVLGVFVTVRVRGQLLCQWVLLAVRFLLRDRAADLRGDQPGAALLRLLRPGAECAHTMIGDAQAFVVSDVTGVGTVLRPESNRPGSPMLSPRDLLPGSDDELAYAVQVVHHAGVDRSQPPRVWLTLQALRTATVYADDDVRAALANVVRRVRRRLRKAGAPFRPLTEQETLGSYAALAHVNAGRGNVREEWWLWHSGPIRHATFRLDGWSALSQPAAARLVRWLLAAAPDTAVTVSCTAHHSPTEPGGTPVTAAVLRIATSRPEALAAAVTDVAQLANEVGVTLNRLDGRHTTGVAATLPVGVVTT